MARPLLPPRGVHVPARMIYHSQLPPAVILTWIQLRGLAWDGTVTPPLRMQELAALTGKGHTTIYQHMSLLRSISALSWRSTGQGTIIVSFDDKPLKTTGLKILPPGISDSQIPDSHIPDSKIPDSQIPKTGNSPSLPPLTDSNSILIPVNEKKIKASDEIMGDEVEAGGEGECEGERGVSSIQPIRRAEGRMAFSASVAAYRSLAHLTPNPAQRRMLGSKVTDLPLWQQTLEHWLGHGWNPKNLSGMLELYDRGGPSGCRYCQSQAYPRPESKSAHQQTLDAIEALRRKQAQSGHPE